MSASGRKGFPPANRVLCGALITNLILQILHDPAKKRIPYCKSVLTNLVMQVSETDIQQFRGSGTIAPPLSPESGE
jgi:hypothetical protein